MAFCTEYSSPLGTLLLESNGESLTGLWMDTQTPPRRERIRKDELALFGSVIKWLDAYFQGQQSEIDFPLSPVGTEFQQKVWQMLVNVPYGETVTYGYLARRISESMSAQAVGGAVGRNPISVIIPCHRVVGAKGQLTGYAGGIDKKKWLLRHEEENR